MRRADEDVHKSVEFSGVRSAGGYSAEFQRLLGNPTGGGSVRNQAEMGDGANVRGY